MKILQVAPQVPYPLTDGGKVGIFNITKHLAERGHEITFVAFDREPGTDYAPFRRYCRLVTVPHSTANSYSGMLLNMFTGLPYNISKYRSPLLWEEVRTAAGSGVDVVHVDHLHMAEYGRLARTSLGIPTVLREHNIESVIIERYFATLANPLLRAYLGIQSRRTHRYEAEMAGRFNRVCPITDVDAARLKDMSPEARMTVVPGGVESEYFDHASPAEPEPGSISFVGSLDWIPNLDAVRWFLDDVLPLIVKQRSDAVVHVVGKRVPPELLDRQGPHCRFHGYVPDIATEVRKSMVSIAPFRIGGGVRLKILEAFALRVPVVATSVGCEGIDARTGKHLLVADSAEEFARAVVRSLDDAVLRRELTVAAWSLADTRYRWERVAEEFESVYREVVDAHIRGERLP